MPTLPKLKTAEHPESQSAARIKADAVHICSSFCLLYQSVVVGMKSPALSSSPSCFLAFLSADFPSQASLLLPHTGDQFVLPTGIHIFLIWGSTSSTTSSPSPPPGPPQHHPAAAVRPPPPALPPQPSPAESAHHMENKTPNNFLYTCTSKQKTQNLSSCSCSIYSKWRANGGPCGCSPKVFNHSAAEPEGAKNIQMHSGVGRGRKSEEDSMSAGENMRKGNVLQHIFLSPLSTLVWRKTSGLPCGPCRDQYYTRVELDLKWSAHLPSGRQRLTWNPLNIYFLSTELTNNWMKWEGKEQLSFLFLISAASSFFTFLFLQCLSSRLRLLDAALGALDSSISVLLWKSHLSRSEMHN